MGQKGKGVSSLVQELLQRESSKDRGWVRKEVKLGGNDGLVKLGMVQGLKVSMRSHSRFSRSEELERPLVEYPQT